VAVAADLKVVALRGSTPSQWPVELKLVCGTSTRIQWEEKSDLKTIYSELLQERDRHASTTPTTDTSTLTPGRSRLRSSPSSISTSRRTGQADAVTLGDQWLAPAIRDGLLMPIPDAHRSRWWASLPPHWRALVTRDDRTGAPSTSGSVYGAPYRWGSTVIGTHGKILRHAGGRPVRDYADLLQPVLRGRVALTGVTRDLLTIALGVHGFSPDTAFDQVKRRLPGGLEPLAETVRRLQRHVLVASTEEHLRAFQTREAWCVVGLSANVVPLATRAGADLTIPESGGTLWADLWCVPRWADGGDGLVGPSPLWPLLAEFGLEPTRAHARPGRSFAEGQSPLLLPHNIYTEEEKGGGGGSGGSGPWRPSRESLTRSAFLPPLSPRDARIFSDMLR
jgi:hypothetical protein